MKFIPSFLSGGFVGLANHIVATMKNKNKLKSSVNIYRVNYSYSCGPKMTINLKIRDKQVTLI